LSPHISGQSTILQFNFNSSGVSWESAANACGHYGLENDQHILRNIHELEGKTFWIGEKVYHVTLPWMEILGRYLDKDLTTFKLIPMYQLYECFLLEEAVMNLNPELSMCTQYNIML
jgi:hypothetical protein